MLELRIGTLGVEQLRHALAASSPEFAHTDRISQQRQHRPNQCLGIARRHLRRIFSRFYRAPDEAVRTRRGTGLGLYVVRGLVESLGGRLEARSEGPARGTAVRVSLPTG